jgi:hypothetical protein
LRLETGTRLRRSELPLIFVRHVAHASAPYSASGATSLSALVELRPIATKQREE